MKVYSLAPLVLAISCSIGFLAGCSSSSSGSNETAISGTIVAAPVNGADVSVVDASGNIVAGPVKTNGTGQYTLSIPDSSLAQDLIVKSVGGTFKDEASGNNANAAEMYAYAAANSLSSGSNISATPGSTIIANLIMNHNKTMTQAQEAFKNAFGYTPDTSIAPADAMTAAVAATNAEKLSGFRAAAFSQLAMDLGLSQNDQFAMFDALAKDLSDGVLDGVDASGVVNIGTTVFSLEADIQNRYSLALINFKANENNLSGLDNAQIGNVPFAKIVLTNTYKIEYVQMGMMDAMAGKSTFRIHITNRQTEADVTGLTPMLMPMMHMATMNHSSPKPVTAITEIGAGVYEVTIYYLMPSQMMDGMSMGFWDLKFTVAGEEAHFYPAVMMAMGDTLQVRLKGVMDKVMGMDLDGNMIMESRTYFIFKDNLVTGSAMGLYDFSIFIAAKEGMMDFPAIVDAGVLNPGAMNELTIDIANTEVTVSANGGAWSAPLVTANGVWSISDLALNTGENQIRVRLTVNSEVKTTDGLAQDVGVNDYQTFTVTTGMSM